MSAYPHDHKPLHLDEGREVRAACTEHFWSLLGRDPEHGWRVVPELVPVKDEVSA